MKEVQEYRVFKDGNQWCAVDDSFVNIQESYCAFSETPAHALFKFRDEECQRVAIKLRNEWHAINSEK